MAGPYRSAARSAAGTARRVSRRLQMQWLIGALLAWCGAVLVLAVAASIVIVRRMRRMARGRR